MQSFVQAAEKQKLQGREAILDQLIKENESLKRLITQNQQQWNAVQSELVQLRTQTTAHQHKMENLPAQPNPQWQQANQEQAGNRLEKQVKQLKELFHSFQSYPIIDSKELFQSLDQLVQQVKNSASSQDPSKCIAQLFYQQQALATLVSVHNLWVMSIQNGKTPPETMQNLMSYLDWIRQTCDEIYSMTQLCQKQCFEAIGIETSSVTTNPAPPEPSTIVVSNSSNVSPRNTYKSTNPFDD